MNLYANEELMWQRLKDVQREAENRRLYGAAPSLTDVLGVLGSRAWALARLAVARPRRRPAMVDEECEAAADAA